MGAARQVLPWHTTGRRPWINVAVAARYSEKAVHTTTHTAVTAKQQDVEHTPGAIAASAAVMGRVGRVPAEGPAQQ